MTGVQSETGVLAGDERMLIGGELQYTSSGAKFDVIHPAGEEVVGQATDGTVADMGRAVGAARRAFDTSGWSRDIELRYHCLKQLQEALDRHKERLRRIVVTEGGCPISVTGSQIEDPIKEVGHWAEHGRAPATSPSTAGRTSASPARSAAPSRADRAAVTAPKGSASTWKARRSGYPEGLVDGSAVAAN